MEGPTATPQPGRPQLWERATEASRCRRRLLLRSWKADRLCSTTEITSREISVKGVDSPVLASRISYVGELGWELYVPFESAAQLWDTLLTAGKVHGAVPVGIGVYGSTGRLEKGYRAYGAEVDAERTIVEAGMQPPKVKAADFVDRDAYLAQREAGPATVLCTLTVDDHTSSSGVKRYMLSVPAPPRRVGRLPRSPRHWRGLGA